MEARWILPALVVLGATCLGGVIALLVSDRKAKLDTRLQELKTGKSARTSEPAPIPVKKMAAAAIPKIGSTMVPTDERERTRLQARLVQAGLYRRQSMALFLGVKLLLMIGPALLGLILGAAGVLPARPAVLGGACFGVLGMVGPSMWLDRKKAARQMSFRRGLPDALDVIVICLEGGLSLVGALRRVAGDLRSVHRDLAFELEIVQREVQLGQTAGEALRRLGERTDMEEIRSLASVIIQSERFGAGLNKALRIHAETLRMKRQHRAEELAQKAGTKVLIPTLLCIFPAIFVVVLGPAMIQIHATLTNMNK
jgi:tight adherence protein C